ncbi:NAD(P)H-hydrate dehydratase [Celeribacter neptunius]|uniref:Bifunctional NAD(P)H-hydrate repair enzyme n=1 Tax=Celeribacter neptunius TaxID=588602 RepID=A0A1I3JWB5_9RHOB|nr:NAD(P)H-hydrate dehydratase [Celeribacter neptunius]SFI64513.1 yjeF C-terminal region, hydroxyethylthiazole kinase-related/yjeF N-terminal region [Celeribacter neptunius]
MSELLTAAQMRAIEQAAIASGEVTGLELMERAGRGVVEAVMEEWPELAQSSYKAVVLCGPGNNGGDGFVVARLLKQRGWEVEVFLYGDPDKLPPDAKANYERWCGMGEVRNLSLKSLKEATPRPADLCVDALFGTGLTRPLEGELFDIVSAISTGNGDFFDQRLVSIDAPSGLCLDSGRVLRQPPSQAAMKLAEISGQKAEGPAPFSDLFARLTVAFDSPKLGHYLADGSAVCGKLVVKDIGLINWRCLQSPAKANAKTLNFIASGRGVLRRPEVRLVERENQVVDLRWFTSGLFVGLEKFFPSHKSHKYAHGHALILSGLSGRTGAARLAARAALRVGAGLVTLGVPHEAVTEVAAHITAVMLTEIDTPEILSRVLTDERLNALCIGPGFGVVRAAEFLPDVLAAKRTTVLDADALTALSESEMGFADLHDKCVLTPHAGEFKRLFPDIAARLAEPPVKGPAYSKVDATREAAKRAGCVVLFKGPDTVIASPNGRCSVHAATYERAAPWLATAGSGDVLSGLITGLMARGFAPHHAAETAAWLHTEAARSFGPGLIAEDLPEELPKVFRALGI